MVCPCSWKYSATDSRYSEYSFPVRCSLLNEKAGDVASQIDGEKIEIFLNDTGSPALIKDPGDFDSIYVVMPMKG